MILVADGSKMTVFFFSFYIETICSTVTLYDYTKRGQRENHSHMRQMNGFYFRCTHLSMKEEAIRVMTGGISAMSKIKLIAITICFILCN